jgi:hypothetical protein
MLASKGMTTPILTADQAELLRYIAKGEDAYPINGALGQFEYDKQLPTHFVDPDDLSKGTALDVLADRLERAGFITVQRQDTFGHNHVTITPAGERYLRDHPA